MSINPKMMGDPSVFYDRLNKDLDLLTQSASDPTVKVLIDTKTGKVEKIPIGKMSGFNKLVFWFKTSISGYREVKSDLHDTLDKIQSFYQNRQIEMIKPENFESLIKKLQDEHTSVEQVHEKMRNIKESALKNDYGSLIQQLNTVALFIIKEEQAVFKYGALYQTWDELVTMQTHMEQSWDNQKDYVIKASRLLKDVKDQSSYLLGWSQQINERLYQSKFPDKISQILEKQWNAIQPAPGESMDASKIQDFRNLLVKLVAQNPSAEIAKMIQPYQQKIYQIDAARIDQQALELNNELKIQEAALEKHLQALDKGIKAYEKLPPWEMEKIQASLQTIEQLHDLYSQTGYRDIPAAMEKITQFNTLNEASFTPENRNHPENLIFSESIRQSLLSFGNFLNTKLEETQEGLKPQREVIAAKRAKLATDHPVKKLEKQLDETQDVERKKSIAAKLKKEREAEGYYARYSANIQSIQQYMDRFKLSGDPQTVKFQELVDLQKSQALTPEQIDLSRALLERDTVQKSSFREFNGKEAEVVELESKLKSDPLAKEETRLKGYELGYKSLISSYQEALKIHQKIQEIQKERGQVLSAQAEIRKRLATNELSSGG